MLIRIWLSMLMPIQIRILPSYTHVGKSEFFKYFHSQHCQSLYYFLVSVIGAIFFNSLPKWTEMFWKARQALPMPDPNPAKWALSCTILKYQGEKPKGTESYALHQCSGSGSTSHRYGSGSGSGSGSFYHHAKIIRKILNPTILWLFVTLFDFLSLKNNVNVP